MHISEDHKISMGLVFRVDVEEQGRGGQSPPRTPVLSCPILAVIGTHRSKAGSASNHL